MAYKKGSAWRRGHWDKWGFWRKVWHCVSVLLALILVVIMFAVAAYVVLFIFGLQGFILDVRDKILLDIMHDIFGYVFIL